MSVGMTVKLVSARTGENEVTEKVYVAWPGEDLRYAGTLVFNVGQWQMFGAALGLGAETMHGGSDMKVIYEGDEAVVRRG